MGLPTFGADSLLDRNVVSALPIADPLFPITGLSDDREFTLFLPGSAGSLEITTDAGLGNTEDVDYFAMIGHDAFTQSKSLEFRHSLNGSAWTSIFTVTPTDDKVIFRALTQVTNRFFQLRVTPTANRLAIGQLQWGTRVEVPFGVGVGYDPNQEALRVGFNQAQTGNIMGSFFRFVERRATLDLKLLPSTFVDGTSLGDFKDFWDNHASLGRPFFYAWNAGNPGNFEEDTIFGTIDQGAGIGRPLVTQIDVGFRDLRLEVVGRKE